MVRTSNGLGEAEFTDFCGTSVTGNVNSLEVAYLVKEHTELALFVFVAVFLDFSRIAHS